MGMISIHVPREGHDELYDGLNYTQLEFQSTCPARGTTSLIPTEDIDPVISIHVPREGHDNPLE